MKIQNQTFQVQHLVAALPDEREPCRGSDRSRSKHYPLRNRVEFPFLHHAYPDLTFESRLFEVQLTFYPMQHLIADPVIAPQCNELAALGIEDGQP